MTYPAIINGEEVLFGEDDVVDFLLRYGHVEVGAFGNNGWLYPYRPVANYDGKYVYFCVMDAPGGPRWVFYAYTKHMDQEFWSIDEAVRFYLGGE